MVVLGKETGWLSAKKELTDPTFLKRLENFDKDNISNSTLKQMGKYTRQKDFNVDDITKISHAAGALCDWVCAMELYAKVFRDVEPRRQALRKAEAKLLAKQEELAASQQQLNDVIEKVTQLEQLLRASEADKSEYQRIAQELESKLNRAASLVESLTGERVRWEKSVEVLLQQLKHVVGDCTIAASFVAYGGPFPITYRQHLLKRWVASVRKFNVIYTSSYSHAKFLAAPTQVMEWNIQGLPSDDHSTENGILVTRGMRWPLMIDPQSQANMWIKVKDENLKVTDLQTPNFMKFVEVAMSTGRSILIQDVGEELDPSLEPILRVDRLDKKMSVVIGDRELHFDPEFRLYFTTKLSNPVFKPELSVKTTVINFAVVEEGLQDQLLSVVVKYEEPKLENDK
jgi:dynein heavy chain